MPTRAKLAVAAIILLTLIPLAGCNKLYARDELNKGVRTFKAGDYETAEKHFLQAIEYDPGLINARLYLAVAYANQCTPGAPSEENKQKCEAAIRRFKDVLDRDPGNKFALSYLASIHFNLGTAASSDEAEMLKQFEESKTYRRRLIEVDSGNPEHYYSIGVVDWAVAYRHNQELRRKLNNLPADRSFPARERRQFAEQNAALINEGLDMLLQALKLNDKYLDAIAYTNLMYRQKADIAETEAEREQYLDLADEYFQRHQRLREQLLQQQAHPASPGQ
jgi:tetratricopeptide (TPR) repeat protein